MLRFSFLLLVLVSSVCTYNQTFSLDKGDRFAMDKKDLPQEHLQWLLYMDPQIGLDYTVATEHCFLFDSSAAVVRACHSALPSHEEIARIILYLDVRRFLWAVHVHDIDAIQVLERNGLQHKITWPALSLRLDTLTEVAYNPEISVQEIDVHGQAADSWIAIISKSFAMNESDVRELLNTLSRAGNSVRLYLGYYREAAAAAGMAIQHGTYVTLHWIGTLQECRNKGLGAAVTLKALRDARSNSCSQALLFSTVMGLPVYEHLGFKVCATYAIYGNY